MTEPYDLIVPILGARVPVALQLEFPLPAAEAPIREPLGGELYLGYGIDLPPGEDGRSRFEYIAPRHGFDAQVLRTRAMVNLRARRPNLAINWFPDVRAVTVTLGNGTDGDLEAGLLLDDAFLEKLAQEMDGELVVGVPARDVFVATGADDPEGLAKLRWVVDRVWARGDHLLVRDLLVRKDGAWQPYTG